VDVDAGVLVLEGLVKWDWGGYIGYFVDLDGFWWEVVYNFGFIG